MGLNLRIPLPGPFVYSHRFGGGRRRRRQPTIGEQFESIQRHRAGIRRNLDTAKAFPAWAWWTLVVMAALTFVTPYTAIFGLLLIPGLWVVCPWRCARRDRRPADPPTEPIDLRANPAAWSNRR